MSAVLIPATLWSIVIALADLVMYPLALPVPVETCDVPPPVPAYSGDHFFSVFVTFIALWGVGLIAFGLARVFGRRWLAVAAMLGACMALTAFSFDHDYPQCNSFSPRQSLTLAGGTYWVPTLLFAWIWSRRRKTD